jgi:hypothetical protein
MFANLQARSDEFLAWHGYRRDGREYRIESPNRDRRAIFCHGGFGLTWIGICSTSRCHLCGARSCWLSVQ